MHAADIMTSDVITVGPDTPVPELATLLAERGISGVPVIDQGQVVGIVSEGNLLHRAETGTERRHQRRRFRWFHPHPQEAARDYIKSHGRTVKDIMTSPVISVSDTADLAEVAELMETNRIKRVPVLCEGKLVGIISRANLVRALAVMSAQPATPTGGDDRMIRLKLLAELSGRHWVDLGDEDILVKDGVVHFWLLARSEDERRALRMAAENIPGVRGVEEHWSEVPLILPI
jgi:CBS domain-containing protein